MRHELDGVTSSFWCSRCKDDFDAPGEHYERGGIEYLRAYCPKMHRCVRYVTNKKLDPYYRESRKMRAEFVKYRKDILQPGDPFFFTYYPHAFDSWYQKLDKEEREAWAKQKEKRAVFAT